MHPAALAAHHCKSLSSFYDLWCRVFANEIVSYELGILTIYLAKSQSYHVTLQSLARCIAAWKPFRRLFIKSELDSKISNACFLVMGARINCQIKHRDSTGLAMTCMKLIDVTASTKSTLQSSTFASLALLSLNKELLALYSHGRVMHKPALSRQFDEWLSLGLGFERAVDLGTFDPITQLWWFPLLYSAIDHCVANPALRAPQSSVLSIRKSRLRMNSAILKFWTRL